MNYSIKRITLDILNATAQTEIRWKKGDTARRIEAALMENGSPYIISDGCYVVFTATKPDGNIIYNNCSVEDNRIIYDVTAQTTSFPGFVECEFKVYGNDDELITCPRFIIVVDDTVYDEGDLVESTTEVEALISLVNGTRELIAEVEKKLENDEFRGEPGVSPDISVSEIDGGHRVTVADKNGEEHFDILNGEKGKTGNTGPQGPPGKPGAPGAPGVSVMDYGAVGDGVADDTAAFREALAAERVLFVPGGAYMLSGTLVIRQNCCMELSQDTVLEFTQTDSNCIEMRSSATLNGNHAVIRVPYTFTKNVISVDTVYDTLRDTPPYAHWDPMWKRGRNIYDVCIVKPDPTYGLHYSMDGTCSGTAIYLSCNGVDTEVGFIWGAMLQGIRIAGAFTYGIHVINYDDPDDGVDDDAWNHDMRIEAVIQGCETAVSMTNCNGAHLAVTVQPSTAEDGTKYAKWGVYLNDCRFVDMMSSFIWDWHVARTDSEEYTHIAMYGNCRGLLLSEPRYYEESNNVRDIIYTDTPSNLDKMTILQEPITRWFKPIDGKPYFSDGFSDKPLMLREEMDEFFDTERVNGYTDVLPVSTDANGSIYNGIGYKNNGEFYDASWSTQTDSTYYFTTGFIPVKAGDVLRGEGLSFVKYYDGNCRVSLFDSSKNFIDGCSISATILVNDGGNYFVSYEGTDDSFAITIKSTDGTWPINGDVAYIRLQLHTYAVGEYPTMSVNEEIGYTHEGFLADGIKVKAENITSQITTEQTDFIHDADGEYVDVPNFTDRKAPYQENIWDNLGTLEASTGVMYIEPKPFAANDVFRIRGLDWSKAGRIISYGKSDGSYKGVYNIQSEIANAVSGTFGGGAGNYSWDASTMTMTFTYDAQWSASGAAAYLYAYNAALADGYTFDDVYLSINEGISFTPVWQGEPKRLDESIYAQNAILTSPNGTVYKLTVSDDGTVSAEVFK